MAAGAAGRPAGRGGGQPVRSLARRCGGGRSSPSARLHALAVAGAGHHLLPRVLVRQQRPHAHHHLHAVGLLRGGHGCQALRDGAKNAAAPPSAAVCTRGGCPWLRGAAGIAGEPSRRNRLPPRRWSGGRAAAACTGAVHGSGQQKRPTQPTLRCAQPGKAGSRAQRARALPGNPRVLGRARVRVCVPRSPARAFSVLSSVAHPQNSCTLASLHAAPQLPALCCAPLLRCSVACAIAAAASPATGFGGGAAGGGACLQPSTRAPSPSSGRAARARRTAPP